MADVFRTEDGACSENPAFVIAKLELDYAGASRGLNVGRDPDRWITARLEDPLGNSMSSWRSRGMIRLSCLGSKNFLVERPSRASLSRLAFPTMHQNLPSLLQNPRSHRLRVPTELRGRRRCRLVRTRRFIVMSAEKHLAKSSFSASSTYMSSL